jgi:hypothetical protein
MGAKSFPGKEEILAEFYTGHDYVFFIPHRHGQGKPSSAGDYIRDLEDLMRDILSVSVLCPARAMQFGHLERVPQPRTVPHMR